MLCFNLISLWCCNRFWLWSNVDVYNSLCVSEMLMRDGSNMIQSPNHLPNSAPTHTHTHTNLFLALIFWSSNFTNSNVLAHFKRTVYSNLNTLLFTYSQVGCTVGDIFPKNVVLVKISLRKTCHSAAMFATHLGSYLRHSKSTALSIWMGKGWYFKNHWQKSKLNNKFPINN